MSDAGTGQSRDGCAGFLARENMRRSHEFGIAEFPADDGLGLVALGVKSARPVGVET
jgi:hypothetical protein